MENAPNTKWKYFRNTRAQAASSELKKGLHQDAAHKNPSTCKEPGQKITEQLLHWPNEERERGEWIGVQKILYV